MPDILDIIDGALQDNELGDDAMRWTSEPPRVICDGGDVLWPEYSLWLDGTYHTPATAIPVPVEFERVLERLMMQPPAITMTIRCSTCGLDRLFDGLIAAIGRYDRYRRAELSRMHGEYRRRSLARRRRKR